MEKIQRRLLTEGIQRHQRTDRGFVAHTPKLPIGVRSRSDVRENENCAIELFKMQAEQMKLKTRAAAAG